MADFCIECGMYVGQGCTCDTDFVTQLKNELDGYTEAFKQEQIWRRDLQSTLNKIKILVEKSHSRISIGSEHCNIGNELKEILDTHEGNT